MSTTTDQRSREIHRLASIDRPLVSAHDMVMLDLDGVVYLGASPVPYARDVLERLRRDGVRLAYVTNNASRPPATVAARLVDLGLQAAAEDVVTSAQAAARLVAHRVGPGATVLLIGGAGLVDALGEYGLVVTRSADDSPAAVVQGFHPDVDWRALAEGAFAVQAGTPWFASNADLTFPTTRGLAPGNGALIAAVSAATGSRPVVAGKPEPALFDETVRRVGGRIPIVVGDRLDTDIEGANRVGADSLAVLTGVSDIATVAGAAPMRRPTYVGPDLRALTRPHAPVVRDGDWYVCSGHAVRRAGHVLEPGPAQQPAGDVYDAALAVLRATLSAAWGAAEADASGSTPLDASAVTAIVDGFVR